MINMVIDKSLDKIGTIGHSVKSYQLVICHVYSLVDSPYSSVHRLGTNRNKLLADKFFK